MTIPLNEDGMLRLEGVTACCGSMTHSGNYTQLEAPKIAFVVISISEIASVQFMGSSPFSKALSIK